MSLGAIVLKLARQAIATYLETGEKISIPEDSHPSLVEKAGVFCTLKSIPNGALRGCIGFPYPTHPLGIALINSAVSAATEDPRFNSVALNELSELSIEVTVLTKPEKIGFSSSQELVSAIEIGKDGLIAEKGYHRGLLLPQVPVEWSWSKEEFLSHTCSKAGLLPDTWREGSVTFYKFQGTIYRERNEDNSA